MSKTEKQKIGQWGENQASIFLEKKEYKIIDRNYRTKKNEDIDIVAWHKKIYHGNTLCFIEVKTRSYGEEDANAERATDQKKISHILRAGKQYCLDKNIDADSTPIQFEQVSVYVDKQNKEPKFRHYIIPID